MTEPCSAIEPQLSAWIDGELDPPRAAVVARHLGACARCTADLEGLTVTRSLLRSAPARVLPDQVTGRMPAPGAGGGMASSGRMRRGLAALAVVVLGLAGGAAFALGGDPEPPSRTVDVPMEVFLADHLLHSSKTPVTTPLLIEHQP